MRSFSFSVSPLYRHLSCVLCLLVFRALAHEPNTRLPISGDPFSYYEKANEGSYEVKPCPYSLGEQMIFDEDSLKCTPRLVRSKRQNTVGTGCLTNIDCGQTGMFCDSTRRCDCLSTYTNIGGACWPKVNPDEGGCTYSRQCSAVWPNAYCTNGQCRCSNNRAAFTTNEGKICLNYGSCPTNGVNPIYVYPSGSALEGQIWPCKNPAGDNACPPGYECICDTPDCPSTGSAFCCPMRGLTCAQNYDEGTGTGAGSTRYYHNPVTYNCEPFTYRGTGGNANHFESEEQCESYCQKFCQRGDPELPSTITTFPAPGGGALFNPKVAPTTCTTNTDCVDETNYDCQTLGTNSYCCPKPIYICSRLGGLVYHDGAGSDGPVTALSRIRIIDTHTVAGPVATYYDEGTSKPSTASTTYARFYFNADQNLCLPFNFRGQGGNLNNFLTKASCDDFCSKLLCTAGDPLKDSSGTNNLACSSSSSCPSTHTCSSYSVCCPTTQTVCSLQKAIGTCRFYVEKWWYNAQTGNCERFLYSGCQGNANNFKSYLDCQNFCRDTNVEPKCPQGKALRDSFDKYIICGGTSTTTTSCPGNYDCYYDGVTYGCCPTVAYTCSQSSDQGTTCGPRVTRFYFNSADRRCTTFEYYGCDGNPNNFATQADCESYCGVGGCPDGGSPFKETNGAYRSCSGGTACPATHYCTQVTLGTTTSYNYCCPTKAYICAMPRETGEPCAASSLNRFFFNSVTRNCEQFQYNGCGGNRNNFPSNSQCLNYCNSAGCPAGTVALRDGATNTLSLCDPTQPSSCPTDYSCVTSSLLGQNICCGVPQAADRCPAGQSPYYSAFTNSELQCQPNIVGNCPSGYVCFYSAIRQGYYCCGTAASRCPQGGSPYVESSTGVARQCTPGVIGACPSGFACQASSITIVNVPSTTGYCCGMGGICGTGSTPLLSNNNPVTCTQGAACGGTYQCTYSSVNAQYYCCSPSVTESTMVCGTDTPYVLNSAPVVCTQGSTSTNCPSPYFCKLYALTNTFYCCQTGGIITTNATIISGVCPPGFNPLLNNNVPGNYRYCSPSDTNSCPAGAYCLFAVGTLQRFLCCGSGVITSINTCPNGQTTTTPCVAGQCSVGLSCTTLQTGQYCCPAFVTQAPVQCPAGYLSTGQACSVLQPLACGASNTICNQGAGGQGICCQQIGGNTGGTDPYGCPQGNSYLYRNTTIPLACTPSGSACPSGYSCQKSTRYSGYQCCSGGTVFPTAGPGPVIGSGVLSPGDAGCVSDSQCQGTGEPNARCTQGRCLCSANLLVYQGRCVGSCPWPYRNVGGICTISSSVKFKDDPDSADIRRRQPDGAVLLDGLVQLDA